MKAPGVDCGSPRGYRAHKRRGEDACQPCKTSVAAYERGRQQARREARAKGEVIPGPGRPLGEKPGAVEVFLAEVEHLIEARQGWGRICAAFDTTPQNLERRLMKHGRGDLATRIFGVHRYEITQKAAA